MHRSSMYRRWRRTTVLDKAHLCGAANCSTCTAGNAGRQGVEDDIVSFRRKQSSSNWPITEVIAKSGRLRRIAIGHLINNEIIFVANGILRIAYRTAADCERNPDLRAVRTERSHSKSIVVIPNVVLLDRFVIASIRRKRLEPHVSPRAATSGVRARIEGEEILVL